MAAKNKARGGARKPEALAQLRAQKREEALAAGGLGFWIMRTRVKRNHYRRNPKHRNQDW